MELAHALVVLVLTDQKSNFSITVEGPLSQSVNGKPNKSRCENALNKKQQFYSLHSCQEGQNGQHQRQTMRLSLPTSPPLVKLKIGTAIARNIMRAVYPSHFNSSSFYNLFPSISDSSKLLYFSLSSCRSDWKFAISRLTGCGDIPKFVISICCGSGQ